MWLLKCDTGDDAVWTLVYMIKTQGWSTKGSSPLLFEPSITLNLHPVQKLLCLDTQTCLSGERAEPGMAFAEEAFPWCWVRFGNPRLGLSRSKKNLQSQWKNRIVL